MKLYTCVKGCTVAEPPVFRGLGCGCSCLRPRSRAASALVARLAQPLPLAACLRRTIYNMCTQKPPYDYSEQLYGRYREAFNSYINDKVRCSEWWQAARAAAAAARPPPAGAPKPQRPPHDRECL